ncbi:MAG: response regulator [Ferruginibacter sp.]
MCYCATDGQKVLEILQNETLYKLQVILLDINMPGMNGWECQKLLKDSEAFKHITVISAPPHTIQKEADQALDMGADLYCF